MMKNIVHALKAVSLLLGSSLILAGCERPAPPAPVPLALPLPAADVYVSFDKLQSDLKKRAREKIGDAPDYSVIVSDASYPIGTLLRLQQFIPKSACNLSPENMPAAVDAPSMFPGYRLSKSVALSLGLDSTVISKVAELGATLKDDDVLSYQVSNAKVKVIFDDALKDLLATPECLKAIGDQKLRMVRGHITGTRDFSLSGNLAGDFKAGVTQIGKFDVSGSRGSGITMKDTEPTAFLLVMTDVEPRAQAQGGVATSATRTWLTKAIEDPAEKRLPLADVALIFVQQDKADKTDARALFTGLGPPFKVDKGIEKMDSVKMPSRAQVRYFREKDRANAEAVAEQLKAKGYASAAPVYIGIAAPAGQLEVWLPKK